MVVWGGRDGAGGRVLEKYWAYLLEITVINMMVHELVKLSWIISEEVTGQSVSNQNMEDTAAI